MTNEETLSKEAFPSVYAELDEFREKMRHIERRADFCTPENAAFTTFVTIVLFGLAAALAAGLYAGFSALWSSGKSDYCYVWSDQGFTYLYAHRPWVTNSYIGKYGKVEEAVAASKIVGCPELR